MSVSCSQTDSQLQKALLRCLKRSWESETVVPGGLCAGDVQSDLEKERHERIKDDVWRQEESLLQSLLTSELRATQTAVCGEIRSAFFQFKSHRVFL